MQTVIMVLSAEYHDSTKTPEAQLVEMERLKKEGQIVHAETFRAQYSFDLELFKHAVAVGRDWMENLYFTFGVLLKTFCHVGPILETCDCDTGRVLLDDVNILTFQFCYFDFIQTVIFLSSMLLSTPYYLC